MGVLLMPKGWGIIRHGHHHEAQRHFEFALNLSPGNFDLRLRLERMRPHLPPPVVVVEPVVPVMVRHRVAILDFATFGDPRRAAGLGPWTAYQLAPISGPATTWSIRPRSTGTWAGSA